MIDIHNKILEFFKSKGDISDNSKNDYLAYNYLETGLLDSMQLIEMIVIFEDEFKIKFTPNDLQSDEFRTIGGLINIINLRMAERKN